MDGGGACDVCLRFKYNSHEPRHEVGFFSGINPMNNESICLQLRCHACCVDSRLRLTMAEVIFLRKHGTTLVAPHYVNERRNQIATDRRAYFDMDGSCGLLNESGLCDAYNSDRPQACKKLMPFSDDCNELRSEKGFEPIVLFEELPIIGS